MGPKRKKRAQSFNACPSYPKPNANRRRTQSMPPTFDTSNDSEIDGADSDSGFATQYTRQDHQDPITLFPCRNVNGPITRFASFDRKHDLVYINGVCKRSSVSREPRAAWAVMHGPDFTGQPGLIVARRLEQFTPQGAPIAQAKVAAEIRAAIAALRLADWKNEGFESLIIATNSAYLVSGATIKYRWEAVPEMKDLWQVLLYDIRQRQEEGLSVKF
ncbi:hypothetical protein GGR51DRAFT_560406 [Nemania sp. FL0031]|nr:hypothetical protein GGR51DRAFT_560406 [Nemania sp. FL0031]